MRLPSTLPELQDEYISLDSLETAVSSYDKIYSIFITHLLAIGGISGAGGITFAVR